jgi:hypothetical protein
VSLFLKAKSTRTKVYVTTWGQYNDAKKMHDKFVQTLGENEGEEQRVDLLEDGQDVPKTTLSREREEKEEDGNNTDGDRASPPAAASTIVYRTPDDILAAYRRIRNGSLAAARLDRPTKNNTMVVYVPTNIMTVDPKAKGVVVAPYDYDIIFYQNEYKRVVMWHLAQGHQITFFRQDDY